MLLIRFADHVCLLLAHERSWTCVTNDGALRALCLKDGVSVRWGLELIALLVDEGGLPPDVAIRVAEGISACNPFSSDTIVESFRQRVQRKR